MLDTIPSDAPLASEPVVETDTKAKIVYLDQRDMVRHIAALMTRPGNSAFGVDFVKKDGSLRKATVLPKGGRAELVGSNRASTPGLIPYYDWRTEQRLKDGTVKKGAWRSFYAAKVTEVRADRQTYRLKSEAVHDFIG